MKLLGTMKNKDGILYIGDMSTETLAKTYGTPLYIYDLKLLEDTMDKFKRNFKSNFFETSIVYASKAFLSKAMCQLVQKHGLDIDAVSDGELTLIKNANFPMEKVHMHGNNKTIKELEMCIEYGVGSIILDNREEIKNLGNLLNKRKNKKMKVMLRINIGIDAHTHEYIKTSKHTSKFGVSIFGTEIWETISEILQYKNLDFLGFHCHIGSQIFDVKAFFEAITTMVKFTKEVSEKYEIDIPEINLGGGFGVYYTAEDTPLDIDEFMKEMMLRLEYNIKKENLNIKKVSIEPGRSIVANAGSTLYSIGGHKETYGGEKYVFIDGGMSDNIRPALYQAKYEATIANKLNEKTLEKVTVAGKCCESGDIILKNIELQKSQRGDLLLVATTGAYGYSMANNYNKIIKPAVIFVKNGKAQVAIKRETYQDLYKNDEFIELD